MFAIGGFVLSLLTGGGGGGGGGTPGGGTPVVKRAPTAWKFN